MTVPNWGGLLMLIYCGVLIAVNWLVLGPWAAVFMVAALWGSFRLGLMFPRRRE